MTVFDSDLDLRGRTVRLREFGGDMGPAILIPPTAQRIASSEEVTYCWWDGPCPDMRRANQRVNSLADPMQYDIIEVLPEPADAAETKRTLGRHGAYAIIALNGKALWVTPRSNVTAANTVCLDRDGLMELFEFAKAHGILPAQDGEVGS